MQLQEEEGAEEEEKKEEEGMRSSDLVQSLRPDDCDDLARPDVEAVDISSRGLSSWPPEGFDGNWRRVKNVDASRNQVRQGLTKIQISEVFFLFLNMDNYAYNNSTFLKKRSHLRMRGRH